MASRSEILSALQGQRARIPDLQALLQDWPQYTNPHLDRLKLDVDAKLEELLPAGKRLEQVKRANIAHFTATWWPYAEYEPLKYVAFLSIWLFNWDDETDSNEFSNMADHFEAEQRFRQDTLAFMRQCLSAIPAKGGETESVRGALIPVAEDSGSSTSSHTTAYGSSGAPSPTTDTNTEKSSPRSSTIIPQQASTIKRGHARGTSLTKITSLYVQHVRRPSTAPQTTANFPTLVSNAEIKPQPEQEQSVVHGKPRRNAFKSFACTIAKYFRPRKSSAGDNNGPEPISEEKKAEVATVSAPRSPLILSFKTIADGICPHFSPYQHRAFSDECEKFINATEREQALRVRGVLPELEEYIAMRLDTGAVAMCLALHEYALGIQLPDSIRADPEMEQIWLQANNVIWIVNDMLSIKKEIAQGETDSLIPILVGQGKDLQLAMDHAYEMTHRAKCALDAAASRLREKVERDYNEEVCGDVQKFVESCQMACTGSTNWSIESGRYKIGVPSLKDGVVVCLE